MPCGGGLGWGLAGVRRWAVQNMASDLISCQIINKEIWKDIHYLWTLIDVKNVPLFRICLG